VATVDSVNLLVVDRFDVCETLVLRLVAALVVVSPAKVVRALLVVEAGCVGVGVSMWQSESCVQLNESAI
jgi:hypothetical protein